ncbi:MAG TPA: hypothetical protein PLE11_12130 [Bacteroidales bacterium]|mgnify:FL=1|nr:hypothetical protein [Bacteroidales bacterium]
MAINLVTGEIKIILEELAEQTNTISQYEGKIPQIELDIIMANIRKLYERYGDLNELNKKPLTSKPINELPVAEKPVPQPAEDDIPEIKITVNPPQDLSAPVSEEKTDLFDIKNEDSVEKQPEKQPEEKVEKKIEEKAPEPEPKKKLKTEKAKTGDLFSLADKETVADKFKETAPSVLEKISAEKNDKTVAEKIGKSTVTNLKSAIGINDKFLFINQLFKGDLQGYNRAIEKLNACTTIEMATTALEELRSANNWDNADEAYQKLEDLVIKKLL